MPPFQGVDTGSIPVRSAYDFLPMKDKMLNKRRLLQLADEYASAIRNEDEAFERNSSLSMLKAKRRQEAFDELFGYVESIYKESNSIQSKG